MINTQINNQTTINQSLIPDFRKNLNTLNLTQIENYQPVEEFQDSNGSVWKLVKSAYNSCIEIPDPKNLQIVNFWNHAFPNLKDQKIYLYVVEGIKQPRVETEKPTKILYQWFSLVGLQQFTPSMISDNEWLKANVYASQIVDNRVSILNALCRCNYQTEVPTQNELIRINEEPKAGRTSK